MEILEVLPDGGDSHDALWVAGFFDVSGRVGRDLPIRRLGREAGARRPRSDGYADRRVADAATGRGLGRRRSRSRMPGRAEPPTFLIFRPASPRSTARG